MPKMSREELDRRKAQTGERARAEVAKTEIMQFRLDAESIERLYAQSAKCKLPVGAMVRQWVLERLAKEEAHTSSADPESETREQLSKLIEGQLLIMSLLRPTAVSQAPAPAPMVDLLHPSGFVVPQLTDLEELKDLKDSAR
jgi:hypothetical protein